jgi:hypothetical protein
MNIFLPLDIFSLLFFDLYFVPCIHNVIQFQQRANQQVVFDH